MKITPVGNRIYEVESATTANITYLVNIGADVATCTCTAFAIKRNREKRYGNPGWCKHLDAVTNEFDLKSRAEEEREQMETEVAIAGIRLKHLLDDLDNA